MSRHRMFTNKLPATCTCVGPDGTCLCLGTVPIALPVGATRTAFGNKLIKGVQKSGQLSRKNLGFGPQPGVPVFAPPTPVPPGPLGPGSIPVPQFLHTSIGAKAACGLLKTGTPAHTACLIATGQAPVGGGVKIPGLAGCPVGHIPGPGNTCINLAAAGPGGVPMITQGGGGAVLGAFGVPAMVPDDVTTFKRVCLPGMVLGKDDLCYPKAVLPGRSKFRKWRRPVRPVISRRDTVAIRRSARAKERVAELAKEAGLFVSKSPRRAAKKAPVVPQHHH